MAIRLGELLIQGNLITKEQLDRALESQRLYGGKLGTNLVELGFIKDIELARFLAKQLQMEAATPHDFEDIAQSAIALVPKDFVLQHKLIPLKMDHKLRVAISDSHDLAAIDQLSFKIGKSVQAVIAPEIWIVAALERYYQVKREMRFIQIQESDDDAVLSVTHDLSTDITGNSPSEPKAVAKKSEIVETLPVAESETPLSEFSERLLRGTTKEEIFDTLLDYLSPIFSRLAVFVHRKDHVGGWLIRGFPVYSREFIQVKAPLGSGSLLETVLESKADFRGTLPAKTIDQQCFGLLKIAPQREIELHPVLLRGKGVAVILGVPEENHRVTRPDASNLITLVCQKVGFALEILALRQQILRSPTIVPKTGRS